MAAITLVSMINEQQLSYQECYLVRLTQALP